jgi:hypothetical protein
MKSLDLRHLFLLAALSLVGCVDSEADYQGDTGKEDGASSDPDRLIDVPFYFSVPKDAVTATLDRAKYPFPTLWNPSEHDGPVGLRIIAVKQGAGTAARQSARRDMAKKLAAAGVLQDGDLVLTFRPELAGTMAYPHIQMGVTHAGLVYTKNGEAFNIDSPLDTEYMGQFDAKHYAGGGDDAAPTRSHIVRPRNLTDTRRAQLRTWNTSLKTNLSRINGERAQIKFQSDYLVPTYVSSKLTTRQTVTRLGRIILEADTTSLQHMYCSEFAWHMLALSNCSAEDIRTAPADGAACVDEVFAPMPLTASTATEVGMADGPLVSLLSLSADPMARFALVPEIFATGDVAKLSPGHKMVSEEVAPLMPPLSKLYGARAKGASVTDTAADAGMLSAAIAANYSPTTFLVHALSTADTRKLDYVVTINFVNSTDHAKAKELAKRPVP